jgi:glycogen(starch) synthase
VATSQKIHPVDFIKMKILIISDLYPPYAKGGYELRCKETADELSRRGHKIVVLTSRWGLKDAQVEENLYRILLYNPLIDPTKNASPESATQTSNNVLPLKRINSLKLFKKLLKLLNNESLKLRKRYYQIQWAFKSHKNYRLAHRVITSTQPDLVFIWRMGFVGITPILAAQNLGIPTVFSLGDYWLVQLKTELLDDPSPFKKKFRAAISGLSTYSQLDTKHLLPNSTILKNYYLAKGFPEENLHVISRGIKASLILPAESLGELPRSLNEKMKLVFVGRLVEDKAPDVAIKALEILRREHGIDNVELDLIGQGESEYVASLEKLVSELNLKKNVKFLGWLEHSKIQDLYSNYDALLFPSRWVEPLGGTVLEAMARGLPVIASRQGGPTEIITEGVNGFLVSVDDPAAFAKAIFELFSQDDLTQRIRIAGIKTIQEQYTLENIVDRNLEYFQKMVLRNPKNLRQTQNRP